MAQNISCNYQLFLSFPLFSLSDFSLFIKLCLSLTVILLSFSAVYSISCVTFNLMWSGVSSF